MNEKEAWKLFVATGAVSDYIEYSKYKNVKTEDINETERKGNSAQIKSVW